MNTPDTKSALIYNKVSQNFQSCLRHKYMNELELESEDIVLDVGCGTGIACKEIAGKVKSLTGFDVSSSMIDVARTRNSADNTQYHVADAHSFSDHLLEWKHTKFDKVMSFFVLNWCADPRKVLENIAGCMKPGGRLLLVFALQSRLLSKKCSFGETADSWLRRHSKWGPYLENYVYDRVDWVDEEDFLKVVRSVGFDICKSTAEEVACQLPDQTRSHEEVKNIIRILLQHINRIPSDLQDECVDDIHCWLHDVTPKQADGSPITPLWQISQIRVLAQRRAEL